MMKQAHLPPQHSNSSSSSFYRRRRLHSYRRSISSYLILYLSSFLLGLIHGSHNSYFHAAAEETQCQPGEDGHFCRQEREECVDFHPQCKFWAKLGECLLNQEYMSNSCRDSCWLCVDEDKLRKEEGWDEEAIQHRKVYANFNPGKKQVVQGTPEETRNVQNVIKKMEFYARHNVTDQFANSPKDLEACRNHYELCAFWASVGECEENFGFTVTKCPLACRSCEHTLKYKKCGMVLGTPEYSEQLDYDPPTIEKNGLAELYKSLHKRQEQQLEREDSAFTLSPIFQPADNDDGDSWVLQLANFLTDVECNSLIKLATDIGWEPSPLDTRMANPPRRTSQSAACTLENDDKCLQDETYTKLLKRIATLLDVSISHIEPIEFVKYEKGESWGVHDDFQFMDTWKPAGPRVLSLSLTLSADENLQGGALGFPDLDWTFVKPERGDAIIWPNVLNDDPRRKGNNAMASEGLPVLEGTKISANVWIRLHNYREAHEQGCT